MDISSFLFCTIAIPSLVWLIWSITLPLLAFEGKSAIERRDMVVKEMERRTLKEFSPSGFCGPAERYCMTLTDFDLIAEYEHVLRDIKLNQSNVAYMKKQSKVLSQQE